MRLILAPSSLSNQPSLSSVCPYVKCFRAASSSLPHCFVCWGLLDCRCKACLPTTGGPKKACSHLNRPLGSLKPSAVPPPSGARRTLITAIKLWFTVWSLRRSARWESSDCPPPPSLPPPATSIQLNAHQSAAVGGAPGHRALLPVGSLPCGGSDHNTVLTTRDLALQPTVIEVISQAVPWWIIKRPETELGVTWPAPWGLITCLDCIR